jgi:hypothetical protein
MKRRSFIQKLAATGMILPLSMGFPRLRAFAQAPPGSEFMKMASIPLVHILTPIIIH